MNDLHFTDSRTSSGSSPIGLTSKFRFCHSEKGKRYEEDNNEFNYLVFLLEGGMLLSFNEYSQQLINKEEFFFIPKLSEISVQTLSECKYVMCVFRSLEGLYDRPTLQVYWKLALENKYEFAPLSINRILDEYFDLLSDYVKNGVIDKKMNDLKFHEVFLLLKSLYPKEDISNLFHPILGKSTTFKDKVLQSYQQVNNVDELARAVGMGRTRFDNKFRGEFGMSPLQWMLKEKAKRVRFSMNEPDMTLGEIMQKYNFSSPTHLNRFCKQQFGCSPSAMMKKINTLE